MANTQVSVKRYLHLTFLGTLGGYHNYTITTLGTVNGSQRGVLKDVDRSNVRRGDIVDVIHLETIDDVQWFIGLCH